MENFVPILMLIFSHLGIPSYFIYVLWKGKETQKLDWLIKLLYSGAFIGYMVLSGSWDWFSVYLRPLLLVAYVVAAVISYRRIRTLPFAQDGLEWRHSGGIFVLLVFAGFLGFAVRGYFYPSEAVNVAFPLRAGQYYIGQGGNSPLLNYHNTHLSQRYALDIVALNAAGRRSSGFYPNEVEQYVIYGDVVHSPCDGVVVDAVDGLPDLPPPQADSENVAGNHVVIECHNVLIALAHLQNGSVQVAAEERVTTGQPLGLVGNSGNTSEPHLHIHAVWADTSDVLTGEGAPLLFDGTFPVRNSILRGG